MESCLSVSNKNYKQDKFLNSLLQLALLSLSGLKCSFSTLFQCFIAKQDTVAIYDIHGFLYKQHFFYISTAGRCSAEIGKK